MRRWIVAAVAALMLLTAVPASAHIPHTEYESSEAHSCVPPHSYSVTLERVRPVLTVYSNVSGYHDVGWSGWVDFKSVVTDTYTYLSAYSYKTVYLPWRTVNINTNYGFSINTYGAGWMKFISSLEHGNVYIDTVRIECDWNWPTA